MNQTATQADRDFMGRALELAGRGWGRVHPNPLVGAVVVHGGEIVGEGFHAEFGGPHAEVVALDDAGERARGGTLYVTLEPCSHYGKTPPCTDVVRSAGVRRVVYAADDPGTESGGGAERLREAGLEVQRGTGRGAAREQNAAFFHVAETAMPYVALKLALSLDARIAAREGQATALTGPAARDETHRLRAGFDAILVGINTALTDDPLLTVRGPLTPRVPPIRIIMDTGARLPPGSRLVRTLGRAPLWILCAEDAQPERKAALAAAGARVMTAARGPDGLNPQPALQRLFDEGVRSIFCEGGGRIAAAMLRADHIERMYLFYAPRLLGGDAVPAFPLDRAPSAGWRRSHTAAFGGDTLMILNREH